MDWPVGAVEPTRDAVTHRVELPPPPQDKAEEAAQNQDLRNRLLDLEGRLAAAHDEREKLLAELEKVAKETAEYKELAEHATAAASQAQGAAAQARLDAGRGG